jgi:hypothetical protein
LFSVINGVFLFSAPAQAQINDPVVTITLDQPSQTADVNADSDSVGMVEFTGKVDVMMNSATELIVTLITTDTWDSATVTPSTIRFTNTDHSDKTFRVNVHVPIGTNSNVEGVVEVSGSWTRYPVTTTGSSNTATGKIVVLRYYGYNYNSDNLFIEAELGDSFQLDLKVQNTGNYDETFSFKVKNYLEMEQKGFNITFSTSEVIIPMEKQEIVTILVKTPDDEKYEGAHNVLISIIPQIATENGDIPKVIEYDIVLESGSDANELFTLQFILIPVIVLALLLIIILFILNLQKKKKMNN